MPSPLRLLLIGAGGIARSHLNAVSELAGQVSVVGVCDANHHSAEALAATLPGPVALGTDFAVMAAEFSDSYDAAVITLPHHFHLPAATAVLHQRKPVLIEKPIVLNLAELEELRRVEQESETFALAGQMQRFNPEAVWMRNWLRDTDEFGAPVMVDINIWQNIYGYIASKPNHWILDGNRAGGGITISVGIHPLDMVRFVTGQDFVEVSATGRFDPPFYNGAESAVVAQFRLSGGLLGTLSASYRAARTPYNQRLLLYGERGTLYQHIATPGGGYEGEMYVSTLADERIKEWQEQYEGFAPLEERLTALGPYAQRSSFAAQLEHFTQAVQSGQPRENTLAINWNTLAMVEAVAQSIRSGNPVLVRPVPATFFPSARTHALV
jgi:predicted dehydrogenase